MRRHHTHERTSKRQLQGQHFVEQRPERIDIGARVHGAAGDLLGRHIGRCSDRMSRLGNVGARLGLELGLAHQLGDTPIEKEHFAVLADHDVGRLDVAMHDPFEVRIFECERHLQENLHQAGHREAAQGPGVFSLDELKDVMKRRPLHHGHRVVRELLFGDAHLVDGDDVRMAQLGENLRLFEKTPELPLVDTVSHRLEGDMAPQVLVENEKDFTHAAFAELAEHDVAIHLISRLWDFGRVDVGIEIKSRARIAQSFELAQSAQNRGLRRRVGCRLEPSFRPLGEELQQGGIGARIQEVGARKDVLPFGLVFWHGMLRKS